MVRDVQAAAQAIGQQIHVLMASTTGEALFVRR
jgi:hypothetical protein